MSRLTAIFLASSAAFSQISFSEKPAKKSAPQAELVSYERVWGRAAHNAFTDLTRYRDRWFLTFREATGHVSDDGGIRVLSSFDAERWDSFAYLTYPAADLRDPKLTVAPGPRLMLTAAGAMHPSLGVRHKNFAWFSNDGREWTQPAEIGEPDVWLWRVQWRRDKAYGFGYATGTQKFLRSYISLDGLRFQTLNQFVIDKGYPNETSTLYLDDESALCLLRRDGPGEATALLGRSRPPYRGWTWTDLGVKIGGPHMLRLPDGRIVAAVRLYDGKARTALCWVKPEEGALQEFLMLPSGGDTSYAGLVYHDGLLYVSYYSSHEERTSIYLAKVKLPPA